ncbi:MAG TPA: alcohol dehydrogenase catalytic domain-containing protein [Solirubrobacterales bacterium]|nr:alcohol dehydrogenase catalytic domain-containing protein [Solirubrobacterales bacterium]
MKAALLSAPKTIELIDRELPPPGEGEVLIAISQCGVCTSELDVWEGKSPEKLPMEIGHEIAGIVEQVGQRVEGLRAGDSVVAWVPGGGFAEQIVVPERHCIAVAPDLAYPAVAEPLACIVNSVQLAAPALGDDVLIIGGGFMGSLLQMVSELRGPRSVIVADVRPDALQRARELGATRVVNSAEESLTDVVAELTGGSGVDLTYEVTGVAAGLDLAGEATRMSGKIAIVGYHQGGPRALALGRWNWMAYEIVNAHFRDVETIMAGMRAGMRLLEAGAIEPSSLISDRYPLADVGAAFERAGSRAAGFTKALVELGGVR